MAKLASLQAARGVSALLVVLYHCSTAIFSGPRYWPCDPFGGLFEGGRLGVELFFAISGFVILSAHRDDIGRPRRLLAFARKRTIRIYPVYWIVLAGLLPVYATVAGFGSGSELRPLTLVSSFLLIHVGTDATVLAVSWTLFLEILFYVLFAVLLVDRTCGLVVLGAWWGLSAFGALVRAPPFTAYPFSDLALIFAFGMLAAEAVHRRLVRLPTALAAAGAILFAADGLVATYHPVFGPAGLHLVGGASGALLVAASAELERRGRIRVPRPLVVLGDASYGIYLVHFPVLSAAAKALLPALLAVAPPAAAASALVVVAVGAGLAFHAVVERPLLAVLSGRRQGPGPSRLRAAI